MMLADRFFATARERYDIMLRRSAGEPAPWTTDEVFARWRFCNVHREHDKTTEWLRQQITKHCETRKQELLATVIFRWFNRIETGERIKDLLLGEWNTEEARSRLAGVNPVVTGAYIIKGPDGFNKLDGVLFCIDQAIPRLNSLLDKWDDTTSLQAAWADLKQIYYLGGFMAYEIVSDLRWTSVLTNAPDILTWANAGPGCARGLGRVHSNNHRMFNRGSSTDQETMNEMMQELLEMSKDPNIWPSFWEPWEMREVEHWACEFDKYIRAEGGDKMKRRFKVVK